MSLFRPRWLDDILRIHPSASPRVRGLKSFEPHHVPALQDPLYSDDPQFWTFTTFLAAAALNFGHIGVQTPNDDSMVCIVDGALVNGVGADDIVFDVVLGGQLLLALANGTAPIKRNRREQARSTQVERVGLLSIVDNTNAFTGTAIAACRIPLGVTKDVPLGFRLFGGEQLFARNATANVSLELTLWGRLTSKGQR